MINGLDYSVRMPDMQAMLQSGISFVCRYVGWSDLSQAKILTPLEAQTLSQNNIAIVSNYEWYNTRPQEGAAAADVDAARALAIHKLCGGPDNVPIYFSVDYNSPGSDVVEYFKELANILGLQRVGAYGGYDCIKYLFDNHLISYGWQTYAWSAGRWDSRAHIRQTQNAVAFGGTTVDLDTGMFPNVGQWMIGGTNVKTNSDGTIATAPFWYQLSENEMDTCGPTSASMAVHTVAPGFPLIATPEMIDQDTDDIILNVFRLSDPKQFQGVGPWNTDMFSILKYLQGKYPNTFHFQIVASITQLEAAVHSGYPCIFGCNEQDISAWNGGAWVHAYPWNISAGHIPGVLVGFDNMGNWKVVDPLNNSFQGHGPPYIYQRSGIAKSFSGGAIIQLTSWLLPIPDVNNWPVNFNAQNFGGTPHVNTNQRTAFENEVQAVLPGLPLTTGIMNAAFLDYQASKFHGPALTKEFPSVKWNGTPIVAQCFAGGRYEWDGSAHYYSYT